MSLRFLFLDFNSFFASVEQAMRPELRGRPVAVVPVKAETASCIAASYEARPFGVKTGTPVREARQLCPGIEIVEARPRAYIKAERQRRHTLLEAVDHINRTRGKNTIYYAGAHGSLKHTPMRIAFNRIPDPQTER